MLARPTWYRPSDSTATMVPEAVAVNAENNAPVAPVHLKIFDGNNPTSSTGAISRIV